MPAITESKPGAKELATPEMGKLASESIDLVLSQLPTIPQYLRGLHDTFTSNPREPYLVIFSTNDFTWRINYNIPDKLMNLQKTNSNFSRRSLSLEQFPLGTKKNDMPLLYPLAITFSSTSIVDDQSKLIEYEKGHITKFKDRVFTDIEDPEELKTDEVYNRLMQDLFGDPIRS